MARDLNELVQAYMDENVRSVEGRRGVEAVCKFARALGYKDPQYWGQLTSTACVGDLIYMLEDNPGMVEAMFEWVRTQRSPEMVSALEEVVKPEEADAADEADAEWNASEGQGA